MMRQSHGARSKRRVSAICATSILTGVSRVDEARVAGGEQRVDRGVRRGGQLSVQVVEQRVDGEPRELVRHQGSR